MSMIIIIRTYKTLSPSGGCRNFITHRETKCFNDYDLKGIEAFINISEYELKEQEFGYDIYELKYDIQRL